MTGIRQLGASGGTISIGCIVKRIGDFAAGSIVERHRHRRQQRETIVANGASGIAVSAATAGILTLINWLVQAEWDSGIGVLSERRRHWHCHQLGGLFRRMDTGVGVRIGCRCRSACRITGDQANGANGVGVHPRWNMSIPGIIQGAGAGIVVASGAITNSGTMMAGSRRGASFVTSSISAPLSAPMVSRSSSSWPAARSLRARVSRRRPDCRHRRRADRAERPRHSAADVLRLWRRAPDVTLGGAPFAINGTEIVVLDPT